jgi:hypothetical protein
MHINDVELWYIYFAPKCYHVRPEPKDKYVVVVGVEGHNVLGFFINSKIPKFIENDPQLSKCQAAMLGAQHRHIPHDSYVDCKDLYKFYASDFQRKQERLTQDAKNAILSTVRKCPTLKGKYKRMILENGGETWDNS